MFKSFTISSGHGKYVAGASCYLNEVTEARRVTDKVAEYLKLMGVKVNVIHDNVSKTKAQNITNGKSSYLVSQHNKSSRELDVSIHFNASSKTTAPRGTEVYYYSDKTLAAKVSKSIAKAAGLKDRGAKDGKHLTFLNCTSKNAILIEICFVDSKADADLYEKSFDKICRAIAEELSGGKLSEQKPSVSNSQIGVIEVMCDKLALRKSPGVNGEFIRYMKKGDRYKVYKKDPATGWYNLGGNQWCSNGSAYVKFTKA